MPIRVSGTSGGIGAFQQGISVNLPTDSPIQEGLGALSQGFGEVQKYKENLKRKEQEAQDATYVANSGIEGQMQISSIREELQAKYRDNPQGYASEFTTRAQEVYSGIINKAPSQEAKKSAQFQFASFLRGDFSNAESWERSAKIDSYLAKYEVGMNHLSGSVYSDPGSLVNALGSHAALVEAAKTYLSPDEAAKLEIRGRQQLASGAIEGLINSNPGAAKQMLDSGQLNDLLGDKVGSYIRTADSAVEAKANKARADYEASRVEAANAFAVSLFDVESSDQLSSKEMALDDLYRGGTLKAANYISLKKQLMGMEDKIFEAEDKRSKVNSALNGGIPLDQTNKKDVAAIDEHYQRVFLPMIQDEDPDTKFKRISSYIAQTGIVPTSLKSQMNGALNSGKGTDVANYAQLMMSLVDSDPRYLSRFNKSAVARAKKIVSDIGSGTSPVAAVENSIYKFLDPQSPEYKERLGILRKEKVEFDIGEIKQTFRIDPSEEPPVAMVSQWKQAVRENVVDHGMSVESAKEAAYKSIEASWTVSSQFDSQGKPVEESVLPDFFRGRHWTKNSPDVKYGIPGRGNDWIYEDLKGSLENSFSVKSGKVNMDRLLGSANSKAKAYEDLIPFVNTSPNFQIVPNPRDVDTDNPTYRVMYQNDKGGVDFLLNSDGTGPFIWRPDYSQSKDFKSAMEEYQKESDFKREKLKQKRENALKQIESEARGELRVLGNVYPQELSKPDFNQDF